jgi:hypothetical protein
MALPPRTTNALPSEAAEYVDTEPEGIRIGIALSGGGIRSAAFNLGALQALRHHRVLDQADYLAAVSGGNYIATALTISEAHADHEFDNGSPLWGRGSPEERYLRQHTDYISPARTGRVWLALSVIYGFVLNYLPFLLSTYIVGRLVGWPLHALGMQLADLRIAGLELPASWPLTSLLLVAVGALLVAVLLVAYRRLTDGRRPPSDYGATRSEGVAATLVTAAGVIGVLLAMPVLAGFYRSVSTVMLTGIGAPADAFDTMVGRLGVGAVWLLVLIAAAATALALSRRFRALRLMLVLSTVAGAGLLLVPTLSSLDFATRHGLRPPVDLLTLALAVFVVIVMAVKVHNRRYSMHMFYRERLNSAFALKRTRGRQGQVVAEPIGYGTPLYFSEVGDLLSKQDRRLPKQIVCCAVNLTSNEVPVGRFAASFTFEQDRSGGVLFGYRPTHCYEEQAGLAGTQLTLPSIMAVSGAALSPLMGRFTFPPLRFLMALTNVRLGVWIKNPLHPNWDEHTATTDRPGWLTRLGNSVRDGWYEPGAWYVLREALGGTKSTHRYIYLTDGGHWENLGLVELLRRRCTHVLCFDASSDRTGAGLDIGRAIALARTELGADIDLEPGPVMPGADGFGTDTAVAGNVTYPHGRQTAKLIYAKAVLTNESSWDLHAFRARDSRFPNHSTAQQVFSDEQFEAYRTLGYAAGCRAVELLNLPAPLLSAEHTTNGEAIPLRSS